MKVAYIGSCFAELFAKRILKDSSIVFFASGMSLASLTCVNNFPIKEANNFHSNLKKQIEFESNKVHIERLISSEPDIIVLDLVRDTRCPLIKERDSIITFPYELIGSSNETINKFTSGKEILRVGSAEYTNELKYAIDKFSRIINESIPNAKLIILNFFPTHDYAGNQLSSNGFMMDYYRWMLRNPLLNASHSLLHYKTKNSEIYTPLCKLISDDEAAYGPSPVHYSDLTWELIGIDYSAFINKNNDHKKELYLLANLENSYFSLKSFEKNVRSLKSLNKSGADMLHDVTPFIVSAHNADLLDTENPSVSDVISSFQWLLGRLPESLETILEHTRIESKGKLREKLLSSEEFEKHISRIKR